MVRLPAPDNSEWFPARLLHPDSELKFWSWKKAIIQLVNYRYVIEVQVLDAV